MNTNDTTEDDIINDPGIVELANGITAAALDDFSAGAVLQRAFVLFACQLALSCDDPTGALEIILDEMGENARNALAQSLPAASGAVSAPHNMGAIQ